MSKVIEDEFPFCLELVCGIIVPRRGEVCREFIFVPSVKDIVARIGVLMHILMYLHPTPGKKWLWCTRKIPKECNIPKSLSLWLESLRYTKSISKMERDFVSPCSAISYNSGSNNFSLCIYRYKNMTGSEVYNSTLTNCDVRIFLELVEDSLCSCTGVFVPND